MCLCLCVCGLGAPDMGPTGESRQQLWMLGGAETRAEPESASRTSLPTWLRSLTVAACARAPSTGSSPLGCGRRQACPMAQGETWAEACREASRSPEYLRMQPPVWLPLAGRAQEGCGRGSCDSKQNHLEGVYMCVRGRGAANSSRDHPCLPDVSQADATPGICKLGLFPPWGAGKEGPPCPHPLPLLGTTPPS